MAIVPEDAIEDATAAVLVGQRPPALESDALDASDGHDQADVADGAALEALSEDAERPAAVEIVPAPEGLTRRVRRRPRPRSGNAVPEADVAAMFDEIAPVYDRLNTVMTLGADRRWRDAAVAASRRVRGRLGDRRRVRHGQARGGAGGTRGSVRARARCRPLGRDGRARRRDATATWSSSSSSPATPSRSRPATPSSTRRRSRSACATSPISRPGSESCAGSSGRAESSSAWSSTSPRPRAWAAVYHGMFRRVSPIVGALAGHRDAYRYLPTSLDGFPQPRDLAATMRRAGLADVVWRRLALGTVALHTGRVPAR